jgi:hypothetical protein
MHYILMKVSIVFKQITNDRPQENDIASRARGDIQVRQGRCAREMRVYMNDLGPALFGFDDIGKGHRMGLRHVAAHDQNTVAIDEVLREGGGPAAPQRYTQTGYGGAVSYTGLVLNLDHAQAAAEELFH